MSDELLSAAESLSCSFSLKTELVEVASLRGTRPSGGLPRTTLLCCLSLGRSK